MKAFPLLATILFFFCCTSKPIQQVVNKEHLADQDGGRMVFNNLDSLHILFIKNLRILDSIADNNFVDNTLSATGAIEFLETYTGIEGSGGTSYFGKDRFSRKDLNHWKAWYRKHKNSF